MSISRTSNSAFVYQIFYDEHTKTVLDPGFIPLDNTANERPDWYEFWVIHQFLMHNDLQPDCWYGFLSPKFGEKTGFTSQMVFDTLAKQSAEGEVALFSPSWDLIAYFLNVFEQGDVYHPGLTNLCQEFCDHVGLNAQLRALVNCASNAVFSNFLIAKPRFWDRWLWMADRFFELVEHEAPEKYSQGTTYRMADGRAPMKTFIQERFASIILSTEKFSVLMPAPDLVPLLVDPLFNPNEDTIRKLQMCEQLKSEFVNSNDYDRLQKYHRVRQSISLRIPTNF